MAEKHETWSCLPNVIWAERSPPDIPNYTLDTFGNIALEEKNYLRIQPGSATGEPIHFCVLILSLILK
jgi:hypothetical protein